MPEIMLDSDLNVLRFLFLLRFDLKFSGQISHGHISAELTLTDGENRHNGQPRVC